MMTNATNLTYLHIGKWSGQVGKPNNYFNTYANNTTGSINMLHNMTKFGFLDAGPLLNISGNISTAFANCYKVYRLGYITNSYNYRDLTFANRNMTGDISILSDKYDLKLITWVTCPNINGSVSNLKNLKKLYYIDFRGCNVTGSKTDLWNNGANITFYV